MDFEIVIDTREQQPYTFSCSTQRRKLEAGDYSVAGGEHCIAVERKSLSDFVHTVIHDADRFRAELEKLSRLTLACIVVEADLDAVLRGLRQADLRLVTPNAVLGAALHIAVRYQVPVYWCGSRQAACAFTDGFLRMAVREGVVPLSGKEPIHA
ncbi:MAG: ERCC4 domain-containing protein [Phycisphaeraceae bacterium]